MRFTLLILSFLFSAPFAYAGEAQDQIIGIVYKFANFLAGIFLGVAVIMFLYSGFRYWQASGDPKKVGDAHQGLIWACVGLAVGLLAFSAQGIISSFL
ncbi:MAG: hypothetical protein HZA35_01300 [Parcubacteria group bacterium]|nr:hypothetical protein [Parcubacteria group bacterium]